MLNQSAEYALRGVVHLAERGVGATADAKSLAAEIDVPANYLSKIFSHLACVGVLRSRKGHGGGFQLARAADRLKVAEIIAPFDDPRRYRECLLGAKRCSDRSACAAHHQWKPLAEQMIAFVNNTTVADLVASTRVGASSSGSVAR